MKKLIGVLLIVVLLISGCAVQKEKTEPVPAAVPTAKVAKKSDKIDYFAEIPLYIKSKDFSEKRLMLPVHLFYTEKAKSFVIESTSLQTASIANGDVIDFDIQFKASDVKVGENVTLQMNSNSVYKPHTGGKEIKTKDIKKIEMKIISMTTDEVDATYAFDGLKVNQIKFKIKK